MAHIKIIFSAAIAVALYATALPGITSPLNRVDQILLASNQGAQSGAKQQGAMPKSDQMHDRTRLRENPKGTPNYDPGEGKNMPRDMNVESGMDQDRDRTRLREDPKGTPNEDPKENNPR